MNEHHKNNSIDQTDDYLEWLAGRREKEPQLDPADEDILKATRLLGTLREHDPRPAVISKIKHAVLATSQHVPKTPIPKPHRFNALMLWKIAAPAMALGIVVITFVVTRPTEPTSHAGKNFKKTTVEVSPQAIVELTATKEDSLGVDASTSFTLKAKEGKLALADVQKNFSLQPAVELAIAQKSDTTYEITPKKPLNGGTVYAASYVAAPTEVDGVVQPRVYSWAYQVRSEFQIIGLLPRDKATGVSTASGIEVTFSATGVTAEDFLKNFTISPAAPGRVEVHQRTLVYIPSKSLEDKTVYTVTVKKGLRPVKSEVGLTDDTTWQFETAAKNDKDAQDIYASFFPSELFETVRPKEPLVFGTANNPYASTIAPKASQFTVYQYKDLPAFIAAVKAQEATRSSWAIFGQHGKKYSTEGLKKVGTYKTSTKDSVLTLGPGFEKGFYLANGDNGNDQEQIPFVVSNIGSYSLTTTTDSLVWAHDLVTKKPLVGGTVSVPGSSAQATIGTDGVAKFATPLGDDDQFTPTVAIINDGTTETPILLNGAQFYGYGFSRFGNSNSDYINYLSTDRGLYQPNDTVQFWGMIRRREQPRSGETVIAKLVQRPFEGRYEPQTIAETTLTTTTTGTFIGSLPLRGVATNIGTELSIEIDGQIVSSKYLSIETYRKPPFQILIQPERLAAIAGDVLTYNISTKFFDGTPVPNMELKEAFGAGNGNTIITTNAQGEATYKLKMTQSNGSFSLEPKDGNLQGVSGSSFVQVYASSLDIVASTTLNDATGVLTGTVYQLQPERVTSDTTDALASARGPVKPNQVLDGKLVEIIYEKTKTGSHYDYLLKQTVDDYQYNTRDEVRETFTLTTSSTGTFQKTFTLLPTSVYRVELSTKDSQEREATTTGYFWRSLITNTFGPANEYSLVDTAQRDGAPQPLYAVGANINLQFQQNGEVAKAPTDGSFLYVFSQRGLRRYTVSQSGAYTFSFSDSDVPSIGSRGVVFTGVGYVEMYGPTLLFDRSTRKLNIALSADKETYNPGDRVQVKVKTTDNNGRGQSARVNLKAIDEGFLTLDTSGSYDSPLNIYSVVEDGVLGTYISHQAIESRLMAEGGGGGGDRIDFKDTAVFTEIATDAQGNGTLTFTLPDNITSWRVTAQGFTDSLLAGMSQMGLKVSKDAFVNVAAEPDQLSRDQASVLASAFGRGLTATDGVAFTFSVVDVPNTETKLSAKAFTTVRFSLPILQPGSYRVRVAIEAKGATDVVEVPVTVSASRLLRRTVSSVMLPSNEAPRYSNNGRTTFRFDDADRNLAYETVWALVGPGYNRVDDVVADSIARKILTNTFKETIGGESAPIDRFLTGKGVALYPIGSENLESGALVAGDESMNSARQQMLAWFQGVLDDPKQNTEQVAQALYGLAQLRQPVLGEIRTVLANQDLSDRDRITLLLALQSLGANEEVRPLALSLLQKYAESQDQYVRVNLGESDDEKIVNSARFAILAAGLGLEQRYGLLRYINTYLPKDERTTIERALATQYVLEQAPVSTAEITYEFDGKTATAELTAEKPLVVSATTEQAKSLKIIKTTGNVSVLSSYQEPFDITKANRDSRLSITRTYSVNGKKTTTFATGDLVRVQFTWSKKAGALGKDFSITDILPTGLRPLSNPWMYDRSSLQNIPYMINGQQVSLYAGTKDTTFYYLARASTAGKTVAEPAILQAFDAPSSIQYSNEAVVEIK